MSILEQREVTVLLACARPRLDVASVAAVRDLIDEGIDWTTLVALSLRHGVTAALLTAFSHPACQPAVPPEILAALEQYCAVARERNRRHASELLAIVGELSERGIVALPFKGPVLAEMLYGHLGQRAPGDLDLFVRRRDVTQVCEVLTAAGYRDAQASASAMTAVQHEMYRHYQCEYLFIRDADGMVVEPHWAIAPRMRAVDLDEEAQLGRAQPREFMSTRVLVHAPEDLFLLLTIHGAKHEWDRLCWVRDVATMLERREALQLDVDGALAEARRYGCARLLLLGASMAHTLLGAPLTPTLAEAIGRDRQVEPLAADVIARLFDAGRLELTDLWVRRFTLRTHERFSNRVRYVVRTLLLPRREHIEMIALPASLAWLYYPLRWVHDYVALPLWILTRPLWKRGEPGSDAA